MSDVILYKKQKEQLAKAVGKAFDALNDVAVAFAAIGITPIGKPERAATTPTNDADQPKKAKAKPGRKAKGEGKQPVARNGGSAFAEM